MEFKDRIKSVRGDLAQKTFAARIGVHPTTVQNYESGDIPKGDVLLRIHQEFGVDLTWLLTGQGDPYIKEAGGSVDADVLRQLIEAVEEGLDARGLETTPAKKAAFIAYLYEQFMESGQEATKDRVEKFLRLVA